MHKRPVVLVPYKLEHIRAEQHGLINVHQHMVRKTATVLCKSEIVPSVVLGGEVYLRGCYDEIEHAACEHKGKCERDMLLRTVGAHIVGLHSTGEVIQMAPVGCVLLWLLLCRLRRGHTYRCSNMSLCCGNLLAYRSGHLFVFT